MAVPEKIPVERFSVGVVIPLFRDADTLDEAVNAVLGQSERPERLILVWDGGDAETLEKARYWVHTHSDWMQLIEQDNRGLGAARNAGIAALQTDWVAFLDADDVWHPTKLETIGRYLQTHTEVDLGYHAMELLGAPRRFRRVWKVNTGRELLVGGNPIIPSSVVVRRSQLLAVGGFLEGREWLGVEDLDLWMRLLVHGAKLGCLSEPLGGYRTGGMSSRLEEHLERVDRLLRERAVLWNIDEATLEKARLRKQYERARVLHGRSEFARAVDAYRAGTQSWKSRLLGWAAQRHWRC